MVRHFPGSDSYHENLGHIECPRCGHHSVVNYGEGRYSCLRCSWQRDVSRNWEPVPIPVLIAIAIIIFILITQGG
ncbi:MAG: hypothetical protein AAF528_11450 [Cyanobacteria bacterium P01_C01_bin.121]